MEIQINSKELSTKKLFIATPMYGGLNHGLYMKSCIDLIGLLNHFGVEHRFSFLFNESLITRARNYLVDEFLRDEKFTHMLFLDADIGFDPKDVLTLLALDKDISGGPYPKKSINWNNVKAAIVKNPNIEAKELETLVGEYVFNPAPGTTQFNAFEPLESLEIGTGFMMVKREVFDKFREAYPDKSYKPDHGGQKMFDGSRYIHAYFDTVIDRKGSYTDGGSDRYLSEDYAFCQMVRKLGFKIWMCPWMVTTHIGTYGFHGNLPAVARHTGRL